MNINTNNQKKKYLILLYYMEKYNTYKMIAVTYNVSTVEWFVFNTFLYKLKQICKTEDEKQRFNSIIGEVHLLQRLSRRRSSIMYMNNILHSSGLSTGNSCIFGMWEDSLRYSIKHFVVDTNNSIKNGKTCCVCLDKEVDVYLSHSSKLHACVCSGCAFRLMTGNNPKCPLCRDLIEEVITIEKNNDKKTQVILLDDEEIIIYKGDNEFEKYTVI